MFALQRPSSQLLRQLDAHNEDREYTCGGALFAGIPYGDEGWDKDNVLSNTFFIKENVDCNAPVQKGYFAKPGARGRAIFPPI